MAYDTDLAARMRRVIDGMATVSEKKMFGGVAYLVNGNMACGVHGMGMIVRIGEDAYARAMQLPHVRDFDMTGRPMKGWVVVDAEDLGEDAQLKCWVEAGIDFASSLPPKSAVGSR
jgi:TfoX/Sxy family transcriptional regulator of competence genes